MADQGRGRGGNRGGKKGGRGARRSAPAPYKVPQGPRQQYGGFAESEFPALAFAPTASPSPSSAHPVNTWARNNAPVSAGSSTGTTPMAQRAAPVSTGVGRYMASEPWLTPKALKPIEWLTPKLLARPNRATAHDATMLKASMESLKVNDPSSSVTTHEKGDASHPTSAENNLPGAATSVTEKTEKIGPSKEETTSELPAGDSSLVAIAPRPSKDLGKGSSSPSISAGKELPDTSTSVTRKTEKNESCKEESTFQPPTDDSSREAMARPPNGFGTRGTPIGLRANHYVLRLVKEDQKIYCYSLAIAARCGNRDLPQPLKRAMKRHIMNEFRRLNPNSVLGAGPGGEFAFNIADEIFAGFLLAGVDGEEEVEFRFDTVLQGTDDPRTYNCTVTLKLVRKEMLDNYLKVFKTGDLGDRTAEDYIRPVDTILRQAMLFSQRAVEIGRGLYIPSESFVLKCGRIAYSKLSASVQPSTAANGLIALILTSGTAFYKAQALLQFLTDNNGDLKIHPNMTLPGNFVDWLNDYAVSGLKVEVRTRDYPRTCTIRKIRYENDSAVRFDYENRSISVLEYHERVLGKTVQYPRLQVVEMTNGSLIPIEFCHVKKHQQLLDRVASQVAPEMVKHYSKPAPDRMQHIQQNRMAAVANNNPVMQSFSLEMASTMLPLEGRVLPSPRITQNGRSITVTDGSWKSDRAKVEKAKALNRWALFYVGCDPILGFGANLWRTGQDMGVGVNVPQNGEETKLGESELERTMEGLDIRNLDLAVFIVGGKLELHDKIKRMCESGAPGAKGLKTQYIRWETANNPGTSANILRKINAKLGGVNFAFARPNFLKNTKTLIIGADVTHPKGAGLRKRPSVAAVVANMDDAVLQYKAVLEPQVGEGGRLQEVILNFGNIAMKLLVAYGPVPPKRIYYYRDGVSEGQYNQVLTLEYNALVAAFHRKYGTEPNITFIIVTKRHQTRLACQHSQDEKGKGKNIPAGTVADAGLCSDLSFDWYLASHQGIQGTTRPAHFIIMIDGNGSTADQLQELSHALAHGFQRTTRSVSLPAPVYYAHLAAERAKEILGTTEYPALASQNPAHVQACLQEIRQTLFISVDGMYWV